MLRTPAVIALLGALLLCLVAGPARAASPDRTVEVFAAAGAGGVLAGERVDGTGALFEVGGLCNVWPHHGFGVRLQWQDGLDPDAYVAVAHRVVHQQRWAVFYRWRPRVGATLEPYALIEYGYESLRLESYADAFLRRFNVSTNNVGLGAGLRWRLGSRFAAQGEAGWWITPTGSEGAGERPQQWSARLGLSAEF